MPPASLLKRQHSADVNQQVLLVVDGVESKPTATIWNTHDPDFPETLQLELAEGATYPYDVR